MKTEGSVLWRGSFTLRECGDVPPLPPSFPNRARRVGEDRSDSMGGASPERGILTPESSRDNLRFSFGVWGHIFSSGENKGRRPVGAAWVARVRRMPQPVLSVPNRLGCSGAHVVGGWARPVLKRQRRPQNKGAVQGEPPADGTKGSKSGGPRTSCGHQASGTLPLRYHWPLFAPFSCTLEKSAQQSELGERGEEGGGGRERSQLSPPLSFASYSADLG